MNLRKFAEKSKNRPKIIFRTFCRISEGEKWTLENLLKSEKIAQNLISSIRDLKQPNLNLSFRRESILTPARVYKGTGFSFCPPPPRLVVTSHQDVDLMLAKAMPPARAIAKLVTSRRQPSKDPPHAAICLGVRCSSRLGWG